jgi:hypothetical protein
MRRSCFMGRDYTAAFGPTGFENRHPTNFWRKCLRRLEFEILHPTSLNNELPSNSVFREAPMAGFGVLAALLRTLRLCGVGGAGWGARVSERGMNR